MYVGRVISYRGINLKKMSSLERVIKIRPADLILHDKTTPLFPYQLDPVENDYVFEYKLL